MASSYCRKRCFARSGTPGCRCRLRWHVAAAKPAAVLAAVLAWPLPVLRGFRFRRGCSMHFESPDCQRLTRFPQMWWSKRTTSLSSSMWNQTNSFRADHLDQKGNELIDLWPTKNCTVQGGQWGSLCHACPFKFSVTSSQPFFISFLLWYLRRRAECRRCGRPGSAWRASSTSQSRLLRTSASCGYTLLQVISNDRK